MVRSHVGRIAASIVFGLSLLPSSTFAQAVPTTRPTQQELASTKTGGKDWITFGGSVTNGRYQFFGTYPRARIFRLDTIRPWKDGENPRLVADLGTPGDQDRPIAWTTSGERTVFGTIPKYGVTGGVLGGTGARRLKSVPRAAARGTLWVVRGRRLGGVAGEDYVLCSREFPPGSR